MDAYGKCVSRPSGLLERHPESLRGEAPVARVGLQWPLVIDGVPN